MRNSNSNIELGSRPSRSNEVINLQSGLQHYNFQYEEDDDEEHQSPPSPATPQNSSLCSQIWACESIKLPIILMLCLYLLDFAPACGVGYYTFEYGKKSILKIQDPEALRFMSANLKADPILDIQIREKGSTCPSGFELFKIGSWPRTVPGCLCDNGDLHATSCNKIENQNCKRDIPSTFPIAMYEWNDSIWCIKRAVLKENYVKQAACPPRYQECYPGGCFLGDCPITKIEIASTGEVSNKFKNGENKYLVLTRAKGELPLINIQITFGDIPCFNQDLFAQYIKNSSYNLSAIKENGCDKYGLSNYLNRKIASQTAYDSFVQNSFPYSVMHLPYLEENTKITTAILSSMTRIKTAKNEYCQDINENAVNIFIKTWDDYSIFLIMVISVLFSIVRFISICEMFPYLSSCLRAEPFEDESKLRSAIYQLGFISFILLIIGLIFSYLVYQKVLIFQEYFERYNSLDCFVGSQENMVISDYLNLIRNIRASFWVYWALLISNILSGFISLRFYIVEKN